MSEAVLSTHSTLCTPLSLPLPSPMSLLRLPRAAPALRRSYATAANVSEAAGVKVLGVDNGLRPATSSVSVIVKAGSRYEPAPGVAHVLKNFAFKVCAVRARGQAGGHRLQCIIEGARMLERDFAMKCRHLL